MGRLVTQRATTWGGCIHIIWGGLAQRAIIIHMEGAGSVWDRLR